MQTTTATILNEEGLHARPAAMLVKLASTFSSEIEFSLASDDTDCANAKSIMSLMGLGLTKGSVIKIKASGDDAEVALNGIVDLINNRFNL
jgi:phosphocarrier protein